MRREGSLVHDVADCGQGAPRAVSPFHKERDPCHDQELHAVSAPANCAKKAAAHMLDTLGSSCRVGCVEAVQTSRPELTTLASCLPVSTVGSPCLSNNRVLKSTPRSLFLPWLLGTFSSKPSESQKTVEFRFMQFIGRIVYIQVVLQRWVPTHCSRRKVQALSAASSQVSTSGMPVRTWRTVRTRSNRRTCGMARTTAFPRRISMDVASKGAVCHLDGLVTEPEVLVLRANSHCCGFYRRTNTVKRKSAEQDLSSRCWVACRLFGSHTGTARACECAMLLRCTRKYPGLH